MTVVLGIDLASRRYADIGIAQLTVQQAAVVVDFVAPQALGLAGMPRANELARAVVDLAQSAGVQVLAIDGPQAWKASDNPLSHMRVCEKLLHTQAKTGLPGVAKPGPSLRFVQFAIDFFDALAAYGWPRLADPQGAQRPVALEVWPTAVWRALELKALPAKRPTAKADATAWLAQLLTRQPLTITEPPSHDELQALVAGLVGLAFANGAQRAYQLYGLAPSFVDGFWREGYIVNLPSSPA